MWTHGARRTLPAGQERRALEGLVMYVGEDGLLHLIVLQGLEGGRANSTRVLKVSAADVGEAPESEATQRVPARTDTQGPRLLDLMHDRAIQRELPQFVSR